MVLHPNSRFLLLFLLTVSVGCGAVACRSASGTAEPQDAKRWTDTFDVSACSWLSTGKNDFFILEPGYQTILEARAGGHSRRLQITVSQETRNIGTVETRVVEERESRDGEVVEVSRNFFAICAPTNDVFYFGEDVDIYKRGRVVGHEDEWTAEAPGSTAGLFMPSRPLVGARFHQEIAPNVAMDRAEITSDRASLKTPAGEFHDCLKIEETNPLEPGEKEYKIYAKGIGVIQDGDLLLTKYGPMK